MDKWFQFISNTISHINIATSEELKIKTYRSYTLLYGLSKHVIYNCGILRIYFPLNLGTVQLFNVCLCLVLLLYH